MTDQPPSEGHSLDIDGIQGLAASAKRVLHCIQEHGTISHMDIHHETRIPERTIRFAIHQLRERGLVQSLVSLRDCRTCLFFVDPKHMSNAETKETGRQLLEGTKKIDDPKLWMKSPERDDPAKS